MRSWTHKEGLAGEGRHAREKEHTRAHWVAAFRVESLKQDRNFGD